MSSTSAPSHKPVIFLAFANDRDDSVGYLRNLPDEARRLRDVLEPAVLAGLCEVEVRANSTAGDIFKVFQDPRYRNRIAIFHYGGHANGYQLLLESSEGKAAAADAGGLAAFLAQQQGLQLVFLNGCSTQQQTLELHDANVSAVLSTSRSIDDKVATDFADIFYQGLAGGATLREAYNDASAAIKTTKGSDLRALYFGDADQPEDHRNESGFPWNMYRREGSENADQWNLPEAVGDPLFGLPPLPEQDLPESPYRHLNWFRREDAEVFFGRGHQIRKLYGLLTAGTQPIILFYGQSGVGKSSLLDAGLMPRLEQSCEVRYLRRRAGGLLDTLQLAFLPEAAEVPIETAWLAKEERLKKPLIVFLDQVEEFYTQPIKDLPDELDQLLRVVKTTFGDPKCRPRGKLVLGFRKEWLAEVETQMIAYELPRAKVSLEPLDRDGIIEVVQGPTRSVRLRERYGLQVEKGLAEIIADDMLKDRGSAISTTLQILLSKMWTEAIAANSESPQFSQELYQALQRDGILLGDFFNQQLEQFKLHLPHAADSGLLLDVLALHTTDLGSANECSQKRLFEEYAHVSDELPNLLRECQDLYLLIETARTQNEITRTTRLAHDTLAPLVRDKFDKSDKPGQRARRILENRVVDWSNDRTGDPMDEPDLAVVDQGLVGMRALSCTERRLLEASRQEQSQRRRIRKRAKKLRAGSVAVICFLAVFYYMSYSAAIRAKHNLVNETIKSLVSSATNAQADGHTVVALHLLAQAINYGEDLSDKSATYDQRSNRYQFAAITRNTPRLKYILTKGNIYTLSIDPGWTRITTGSANGTARSWDPRSGELVFELLTKKLHAIENYRIIATDSDGIVKAWDAVDGKQLYELNSGPRHVEYTKVSPNGKWVHMVCDGEPETAALWDLESGQCRKLTDYRCPLENMQYRRVADFTPNGDRLAVSSNNGVQIWDTQSGILLPTAEDEFAPAFSPDGRWCATDDGFFTIQIRDTRTGARTVSLVQPNNINGRWFGPHSNNILVGLKNGTARSLSVTSKETPAIEMPVSVTWINIAAESPDGTRRFTWSIDGKARLWDSSGTTILADFPLQNLRKAVFSDDSKHLAVASDDGNIRLYEPISGHATGEIVGSPHTLDLKFNADGSLLAVVAPEDIRVWSLVNENQFNGVESITEDFVKKTEFSQYVGSICAVGFGPKGAIVVTQTRDSSTCRVYEADVPSVISLEHVEGNPIYGASLNLDGTKIVGHTGRDETIVWDLSSGKRCLEWDINKEWGNKALETSMTGGLESRKDAVAFDQTDTKIICFENDVASWWKKDMQKPTPVGADLTSTRVFAFSHAFDLVFGARLGCEAEVLDLSSRRSLVEVTGCSDDLFVAAFSADDRLLATGHRDGKTCIWSATEGRSIAKFEGHGASVVAVSFNQDSSAVIIGSSDGAVKIWSFIANPDIGDGLQNWVKTHTGTTLQRNIVHPLTVEEWREPMK